MLAALDLSAELGGELAIAVFKYALADWQTVASAIKFEMEARPGYNPRFYKYPSISVIRSFWRASVHAYVQAAQSGDLKKHQVPDGLEILASPASWKILAATDPFIGHPGVSGDVPLSVEILEAVVAH